MGPEQAPELHVRFLGRVPYDDALALQRALQKGASTDHLLLLEHNHVYTTGVRTLPEHLLVDPASVGAQLTRADRGGSVTYHGPGQLVGYPILSWPFEAGSVARYVHALEQLVIDVLDDLGLHGAGRFAGSPGVWIDPDGDAARKICALGVRVSRGRTTHGFALNVDPDLAMFANIVPCGITDKAVTSLAAEGVAASLADVVAAVGARAHQLVRARGGQLDEAVRVERQEATAPAKHTAPAGDLRPIERRLAAAGVETSTAVAISERKPSWLRVEARMGEDYLGLRKTIRSLELTTVCEEAGCPNIYECWSDGTATFMINGERCTRACGFCLVDTSKPLALDAGEPLRIAEAVAKMHLAHAVVTAVARDDLPDGGAAAFAATIDAIRVRTPTTTIEVLIPDCKGDAASLATIFAARPDVLNHNLETVLRLQRAVRPSAGYARSLALLARAKSAGLTTKSGLILGMGEEEDEVLGALVDLASVGVDIVTIGQYLRPTKDHLPVARWWHPDEIERVAERARTMGFAHVEASPLTRSSYHARQAVQASLHSVKSA